MERIIPKGFFSQIKSQTITKETLEDRIPLEWEEPIEFEDNELNDVENSVIVKKV